MVKLLCCVLQYTPQYWMITRFMHHVIYMVHKGTSKKNHACKNGNAMCIHKTMFYHSTMSKSWYFCLYSLDFSITLTCIYLSEHELRTSAKTQVPKLLGKVRAKTEMQLLQCMEWFRTKSSTTLYLFFQTFLFHSLSFWHQKVLHWPQRTKQ